MKQEQIIKCGGQKIKVFNCDPEKNTQCDKEFCMHNRRAVQSHNESGFCSGNWTESTEKSVYPRSKKLAF